MEKWEDWWFNKLYLLPDTESRTIKKLHRAKQTAGPKKEEQFGTMKTGPGEGCFPWWWGLSDVLILSHHSEWASPARRLFF